MYCRWPGRAGHLRTEISITSDKTSLWGAYGGNTHCQACQLILTLICKRASTNLHDNSCLLTTNNFSRMFYERYWFLWKRHSSSVTSNVNYAQKVLKLYIFWGISRNKYNKTVQEKIFDQSLLIYYSWFSFVFDYTFYVSIIRVDFGKNIKSS